MRASLTKLTTRVNQLEGRTEEPGTPDLVQQAKLKLQKLDSEFKSRHYDLLDVIEEEHELEAEQATLAMVAIQSPLSVQCYCSTINDL